jgi:hypothetical protein
MVTTVIALVAGILLVVLCASRVRFQGVVESVTRAPLPTGQPARTAEHPLVRTCRMFTLAVGVACIVLGALGILELL